MKRLVVTLFFATGLIQARYETASSEDSLRDDVNKYRYSVVCFYDGKDGGDEVKDFLRSAAKIREYKKYLNREVAFNAVNVAKSRAEDLKKKYNLTQFPVCMLFERGSAVKGVTGYLKLVNPTSTDDIVNFLEKEFDAKLDSIIDDKKEEEKLDREERIARYEADARWGYPYNNYYWYNWPYGRSYYYPYYHSRHHRRDGAHIGFGFYV